MPAAADPPSGPQPTPQPARLGVGHGVTRAINRDIVLELIKTHGPLSRAALARRAGLTKATVGSVVDQLLADGVVHDTGQGASAPVGGRPPRLLAFNSGSRHLVGIAIGARRTSVLVTDALGGLLDRRDADTPGGDADRVLAAAARLARRTAAGAGADSVAAVGVVVPGIVDPATSICRLAPNLGWRDVPVRAAFTGEFGAAPVFVHNIAQAVAAAEASEGAAVGHQDVVCIYASIGIGAGILRRGRLVLGSAGMAGEIGHCVLPGGEETCNCGNVGCLETVASGPAIERRAAAAVAAGEPTTLTRLSARPTARDVAAAAAGGDTVAARVLDEAARPLGMATSWLVNAVNPSIVVVAGGLAEIGAPLLEPVAAAVRRHALPPAGRELPVRPAALGADGSVRGAVLLARQYADDHLRSVFRSDG